MIRGLWDVDIKWSVAYLSENAHKTCQLKAISKGLDVSYL